MMPNEKEAYECCDVCGRRVLSEHSKPADHDAIPHMLHERIEALERRASELEAAAVRRIEALEREATLRIADQVRSWPSLIEDAQALRIEALEQRCSELERALAAAIRVCVYLTSSSPSHPPWWSHVVEGKPIRFKFDPKATGAGLRVSVEPREP